MRLERFECWLSARFPLVWRTRVAVWICAGLLGSMLAALYAWWVVRLDHASFLSPTLLSLLATSVLVPYFIQTLLVVDVVRRTSSILSASQRARLSACLVASTIALMWPSYAFERVVWIRIAAAGQGQISLPSVTTPTLSGDWLLHVAVAAILAGGITALLVNQTTLHTKSRRILQSLTGWRWRPSMARLVDGWLASRWPTLWSSRIHVSIARFVAFPILFALFVWTLGNSSSYASILAVVVVLSFFALLRTQEGAHYLITDARHETSVYVVHAVLTTSAALGATAIGAHDFRDGQERSFMLWFAVFLCAALQAVRSSSALVAFACVIVVPFIYLPFLFLVIASGASPSSATFYISLSIPMVIGASLLAWSIDRQARASVRRWFVSLTVLTAPLPALTCALVTGIESGKGATWSLLLSGLLVVVAMRLTLRFTEDVRRSLAIAAT